MPGMQDAARDAAMAGLGGAGGGMPEPPPEEGMEPMGAEGGGDFEGLITPVEGFFDGLPGDVAEQARSHINALRDLAAQGGGEEAAPVEPGAEDAGAGAPPGGGADLSALMSGMGG